MSLRLIRHSGYERIKITGRVRRMLVLDHMAQSSYYGQSESDGIQGITVIGLNLVIALYKRKSHLQKPSTGFPKGPIQSIRNNQYFHRW